MRTKYFNSKLKTNISYIQVLSKDDFYSSAIIIGINNKKLLEMFYGGMELYNEHQTLFTATSEGDELIIKKYSQISQDLIQTNLHGRDHLSITTPLKNLMKLPDNFKEVLKKGITLAEQGQDFYYNFKKEELYLGR
jgi:hypothetical protein